MSADNGLDIVVAGFPQWQAATAHGGLTPPTGTCSTLGLLQDAAAAFAGVAPRSPKRRLKQVSRTGGIYYELLP
ncbi:MAG TPA: hypothetical protein VGI19_16080 [Candidatus Cybelea sp.]